MFIDFPQFIGFVALILWIDFFMLSASRKLKSPDYLAHILTGFVFAAIAENLHAYFSVPLVTEFAQISGLFKGLVYLGLFFFFFEFAFRTPLDVYRINTVTSFREVLFYTVPLIVIFALAVFFLNVELIFWTFLIVPFAFLATDVGGIVTGDYFSREEMRMKFLDYIQFSLGQEVLAVILFIISAVVLDVRVGQFWTADIVLALAGLLIFGGLTSNRLRKWRGKKMKEYPSFLIIIGILSIIIFLALRINFPVVATGFICGIILKIVFKRNNILRRPTFFGFFRFFVIFPTIALGILFYARLDWTKVLLDGTVILFVLLVSGFPVCFYWMRQQKEYLVTALLLLFRSEFTFFLLLWGFMHGIVHREFLIAAILLSFLLHILARSSLIYKLSNSGH